MADNEFVSLSVTEDRLATDKDGAVKKQLLEQLNSDLSELKQKKNTGLAPEQFACTDALINAIDDAVKVIELTWHKHNMSDKQH
ncbi:EscE/YscE/SsaE family type III secretion system needle protein co-chaperone [Sansalvadorimonas sp. 2012CJ34-2]|uniref:EscE/YscE/SsaE family type III secretion system needle protein co-chaperone n=1 Tax=Parendozoicomonas callyspongiae TaxID=2942213 RepID=A0ABT0PCH7_9GAMM|nr:EscE/YscE/SsaE family type III secretion system needle protein co-chaperone [Sansalvadorimonas sp. 2012CJ34-2]MCL6269003.1 EscE/YscE/SsaE family type III secretion system needle protein co-chaperone [Sansalvadorimonas sp. 2012CJ34-2]